MVLNDVSPDTIRRAGAMALYVLNKHIELKARVAPERLKVCRNMQECWRPNQVSICIKLRLTLLSVRGTYWAASFFT